MLNHGRLIGTLDPAGIDLERAFFALVHADDHKRTPSMNPAVRAAVHVEVTKARAGRVIITTTVLLVAGIAALAGSLTWAATSGNEQVIAQLGPMGERTGWNLLLVS